MLSIILKIIIICNTIRLCIYLSWWQIAIFIHYIIQYTKSGVCLPSLKKRLGPSLSCRFQEYTGERRNLIGWFRRLETKEHCFFMEKYGKPKIGVWCSKKFYSCVLIFSYKNFYDFKQKCWSQKTVNFFI